MIETVEDLIEAYIHGNVVGPLVLDNDHVSASRVIGELEAHKLQCPGTVAV